MAAIVKDDKDPNEKAAGENGQGDSQPPGDGDAAIHEVPQDCVRDEGISDMPESPRRRGYLINGDDFYPGGRIR